MMLTYFCKVEDSTCKSTKLASMEQQQSGLPVSEDIVLKCGDSRGKAKEESKRIVQPLIISRRCVQPLITSKRSVQLLSISERCVQPLSNLSLLGPISGEVTILPDPSIYVHGPCLGEVLPQLIHSETDSVRVVNSTLTSLHEPGLGEVRGLISVSATTLIRSLVEQDMVNLIKKYIPPVPVEICTSTLTGQTLFEVFAIHTDLCMIKTIIGYDDEGGTIIYKYKNGQEEQFVKRRNLWLSKDIGNESSNFVDSLVLSGPTSPISAWAGCWGIEIDVPVGSSLLPENCAKNEIPRTVFKRTLELNDYFLNKPKSTMIFARGGFINITSVAFTNAVQAYIRFILHAIPEKKIQFVQFAKVHGELTLVVDDLPVGFTIFKNQVPDDAVDFMACNRFRDDCRAFELPLTRDVLALPIGSRLHVTGILMVGHMRMVVDQHLVLDRDTVWAEWTVDQFSNVTICINSSSFF